MPDDVTMYDSPTLVVTASDGTRFTCRASRVGSTRHPTQIRWRLTDVQGRDYIGPTCIPGESPIDLQGRVSRWWNACKALQRQAAIRNN